MFKEILKIIPQLDGASLGKLEKGLNGRFAKVAKKFGGGITKALVGGGLLGLASGLIDKLLNPLKEVQEAIDRTLKDSDDVVTNAKMFNTDAGKLAKLIALAKSTGLDEDSLFVLMTKFQQSVAEAEADPTKQTSVRQFTGIKDTAEGFFKFIQGLQKLDKTSQLLVQQEVFGEKQILKMADFLQTEFPSQLSKLAGPNTDQLTKQLNKLGDMNDLFTAKRYLNDIVAKGNVINPSMIAARDAQARLELSKENDKIASYHALMKMEKDMTVVIGLLEKGYVELLKVAQKAGTITDLINAVKGSRAARGLMSTIKGE